MATNTDYADYDLVFDEPPVAPASRDEPDESYDDTEPEANELEANEPEANEAEALREFFPYQQIVFDKVKDQKRIALFLEQRLGKTLIAIRWFRHNNCKRVLIVCPKGVIPVWQDELAKEFGEDSVEAFSVFAITAQNRKDYVSSGMLKLPEAYVIANYEEVKNNRLLSDYEWDCVILDESSRIRKQDNQLSKYFVPQDGLPNPDELDPDTEPFPFRAVLSGTPRPEQYTDYFNQFKFLDGSFMGERHFYKFTNQFCYREGWKWGVARPAAVRIDNYVKERAACLTRKEAGIDNVKLYETVKCSLGPSARQTYDDIEASFEFGDKQTNWQIVAQGWLHQLAGGLHRYDPNVEEGITYSLHKLNALVDLIEDGYVDQQLVIVGRFNNELRTIGRTLGERFNLNCDYLLGSTSVNDRRIIMDNFWQKRTSVILAQPKVLQFGINLSCASTMIFFSNSWEYETRAQSEDRLVAPGKTEPNQIIDLVTKDTIDEDIIRALAYKRQNAKLPKSFNDIIFERFRKRTGR